MKRYLFEINVEQPLILSESGATAGEHRSLDYIPGSALLGLAASRLYAQLTPAQQWTLFHSGDVRFGDALPLTSSGERAWPVPLCWHSVKGGDAPREQGSFHANRLVNLARGELSKEQQPQQLRGGYVATSGQIPELRKRSSLKTAISEKTGTAAEGQLFSYEAIEPGCRFRFELMADPAVDEGLLSRLQQQLSGPARLGRSRNAQYGAVTLSPVAGAASLPQKCSEPLELTLWLLSDLALSQNGQPCLTPEPALLGLPSGSRWLVGKSFLRSRRYSSYNAYRRSYDSERQVICRGSVLSYSLPRPLTAEECAALEAGLGEGVETGLGQVWVNPPLLAETNPSFEPLNNATAKAAPAVAPANAQTSLLLRRLQQRQQRRQPQEDAQKAASKIFDALLKRVAQARRYLGLAPGQNPFPSASQWGRLRGWAADPELADTQLYDKVVNGVNALWREAGTGDKEWNVAYGLGPDDRLDRWLRQQILQVDEGLRREVLGQLAVKGHGPEWIKACEGRQQQGDQA